MKTMKIRFPVAVSGTAWSAQGWSANSGRTAPEAHEEQMRTSAREGVFDTVGSDPNAIVIHWAEVEVPVTESLDLSGKLAEGA